MADRAPDTRLLIRADASPEIGTGHVIRCLSLAEAHRARGGTVTFLSLPSTKPLEERIVSAGAEVRYLTTERGSQGDAAETLKTATEIKAAAVILDGYCFEDAYQTTISNSGLRSLVMDDYGHAKRYSSNLILNQNLGADPRLYAERSPSTQVLLGPAYALLRPDFAAASKLRTFPAMASKILVTLGGSDPDNSTSVVLRGLLKLKRKNLDVTVLVGGENQHGAAIEEIVTTAPFPIRVKRDVRNMPELMAWADIAITASGTTTWELLCMGVPFACGTIAANQEGIAASIARAELAVVMGRYGDLSPALIAENVQSLLSSADLRKTLSERGRTVVDGKGSGRVLDALL